MAEINNWSNDKIESVFDVLGLGKEDKTSRYVPFNVFAVKQLSKNVVLPKLSDNSVPLPSGSLTDADMERFSG